MKITIGKDDLNDYYEKDVKIINIKKVPKEIEDLIEIIKKKKGIIIVTDHLGPEYARIDFATTFKRIDLLLRLEEGDEIEIKKRRKT